MLSGRVDIVRNLREELKWGGGRGKKSAKFAKNIPFDYICHRLLSPGNIRIAGLTACNMIGCFIKYMHVFDLMIMRLSLATLGQTACFTPPICCNSLVYRMLCTFGVCRTSKAALVVCTPVKSIDTSHISSKNHSLYNHI